MRRYCMGPTPEPQIAHWGGGRRVASQRRGPASSSRRGSPSSETNRSRAWCPCRRRATTASHPIRQVGAAGVMVTMRPSGTAPKSSTSQSGPARATVSASTTAARCRCSRSSALATTAARLRSSQPDEAIDEVHQGIGEPQGDLPAHPRNVTPSRCTRAGPWLRRVHPADSGAEKLAKPDSKGPMRRGGGRCAPGRGTEWREVGESRR